MTEIVLASSEFRASLHQSGLHSVTINPNYKKDLIVMRRSFGLHVGTSTRNVSTGLILNSLCRYYGEKYKYPSNTELPLLANRHHVQPRQPQVAKRLSGSCELLPRATENTLRARGSFVYTCCLQLLPAVLLVSVIFTRPYYCLLFVCRCGGIVGIPCTAGWRRVVSAVQRLFSSNTLM